MKSLTILDLPIRDIDVPTDRARDYDETGAQMLVGVIAAQGLQHPIRVWRNGERYILISGLLRLRAFELMQRDMIAVTVSEAATVDEARQEEVMENLGRAELNALDRCHHLFELKRVYDLAYPDASRPGRRGNGKTFPISEEAEVFGLASAVAEKVGLSKRAINMAVKIWTDLTPASRLRLVRTKMASKQTELKALSEQKPAFQSKILDLILGEGHPDIENVATAIAFLQGGVQPTGEEKRLQALRDGIRLLPDPVFDRLIAEHADRTIAALQRMGRL